MDKVNFNLHNLHYAIIESITNGVATYDTPVHIPGAVSFSLSPEGSIKKFYADGMVYYKATANNGYKGDLEMALFPTTFLTDILGYIEDTVAKVIIENSKGKHKDFALLFEQDGDVEGTKFVLYNCTTERPKKTFKTNEDEIEVETQTAAITASALPNGNVLAMTQPDTTASVISGWYQGVWQATGSDA